MFLSIEEIGAILGGFLWPMIRVSAFILAAPIFTIRGVPASARASLAIGATVAMLPVVGPIPAVDPLSGEGILIVFQQIIIGVSLGFVLRLVFAAVVTAGQLIALGMGLGFASMVDPSNGLQVPVVSMFYMIMSTLLFLAFDGHLVAIQVLAESFQVIPIGTQGLVIDGFWDIVMWGSWIFAGAVLIALPAITAILVINIGFGVMTRAAPQLNIFAVGFPIIMTVGFGLMFVTLPMLQPQFEQLTESALILMRSMLQAST